MILNQVPDEHLYQKVSIPDSDAYLYQIKASHGITSDTAFLVDYMKKTFSVNEPLNMLDIGTGNGIIPIMLKQSNNLWKIQGIEIQEKLYRLAELNVQIFNESNDSGISLIHKDLKEFQEQNYDVLISNPPYFTSQQYRISPIKEKAISRHEICLNMNDIFQFFSKQKSETSRLVILYPALRRNEVADKIKAYQMSLVHEYPCSNNENEKTVYLFDIAKKSNIDA